MSENSFPGEVLSYLHDQVKLPANFYVDKRRLQNDILLIYYRNIT
jgi:hypothetical protein